MVADWGRLRCGRGIIQGHLIGLTREGFIRGAPQQLNMMFPKIPDIFQQQLGVEEKVLGILIPGDIAQGVAIYAAGSRAYCLAFPVERNILGHIIFMVRIQRSAKDTSQRQPFYEFHRSRQASRQVIVIKIPEPALFEDTQGVELRQDIIDEVSPQRVFQLVIRRCPFRIHYQGTGGKGVGRGYGFWNRR